VIGTFERETPKNIQVKTVWFPFSIPALLIMRNMCKHFNQ
jgi:hypothetical protein